MYTYYQQKIVCDFLQPDLAGGWNLPNNTAEYKHIAKYLTPQSPDSRTFTPFWT
jgi:hypothetical protein